MIVEHHSFAAADKQSGRDGDFTIGDAAIHVTMSPGVGLMDRCKLNIKNGRRPIIVTPASCQNTAKALAVDSSIAERIEIVAAEHLVTLLLHQLSGFDLRKCRSVLKELVRRYNNIVTNCETEPGLNIDF